MAGTGWWFMAVPLLVAGIVAAPARVRARGIAPALARDNKENRVPNQGFREQRARGMPGRFGGELWLWLRNTLARSCPRYFLVFERRDR